MLSAVLLALAVRLMGVRLGLPYFHHADEWWVVDNARQMVSTEDSEPTTYQYGAPHSAIMAWVFRMVGDHWTAMHWTDASDGVIMRLLARLVTVVISSSGAAAVYLAARYATPGDGEGPRRGAYAALLYATAAQLVTSGRYGVTDADLVALVAWALAFCALFFRSGRFVWAVATLALAAMAFSFKVTAATALAIPALAFTLRAVTVGTRLPATARVAAGRAALLAVVPAGVFIFLRMNPHVLIHWQAAIGDIQSRARQTIDGGFPSYCLRTPGWSHVEAVVVELALLALHRWTFPALVAAAVAVIGIARAIRDRALVCLVGAVHALIAVLSIALTSKAFLLRNYLVTFPVLCIGFGFAMSAATSWLRGRTPARWWSRAPWLQAAFGIVYVAVPFAQAVRAQQLSKDARTRAVDWIVEHTAGKPVSVAWTPDVLYTGGLRFESYLATLKRPQVTFEPMVDNAEQAARSQAKYVAIVSHADGPGDFGDVWPFRQVEGFEAVATFDANPYEDIADYGPVFDVIPAWDGRAHVLLLARRPARPQGP